MKRVVINCRKMWDRSELLLTLLFVLLVRRDNWWNWTFHGSICYLAEKKKEGPKVRPFAFYEFHRKAKGHVKREKCIYDSLVISIFHFRQFWQTSSRWARPYMFWFSPTSVKFICSQLHKRVAKTFELENRIVKECKKVRGEERGIQLSDQKMLLVYVKIVKRQALLICNDSFWQACKKSLLRNAGFLYHHNVHYKRKYVIGCGKARLWEFMLIFIKGCKVMKTGKNGTTLFTTLPKKW